MHIIALFNLKEGARRSDYESWARGRDLPTVNGLPSVKTFQVLRSRNLLFAEGKPPFDYIEVFDVASQAEFLADCENDSVAALGTEMSAFTDGVIFIAAEEL